MANRSRRNKLRYQADRVQTATNHVFEHLKYLDELADGESEYITDGIKLLVSALVEWEHGFERFKDGL